MNGETNNAHIEKPFREALEAWADTHEGLIDEVENIPARKFEFPEKEGQDLQSSNSFEAR